MLTCGRGKREEGYMQEVKGLERVVLVRAEGLKVRENEKNESKGEIDIL